MMSTSPKTGLRPAASSRENPQPQPEVQPFPYAAVPAPSGAGTPGPHAWASSTDAGDASAREAQSRAQGRREGEAEARKLFEDLLAREKSRIASALSDFARERAAYLRRVEPEVVQLALSIARRILHRESQLDPLLLAGIVRVTLEKIDRATVVKLRTHPHNAAGWSSYFTAHMEPAEVPEIVEDASLPPDSCVLETALGTATVALQVQLKEIEQGLMDLLGASQGVSQ
jgi:flagellar assembly protein FliH